MGDCSSREVVYSERVSPPENEHESGVYRHPSSINGPLPRGFLAMNNKRVETFSEAFLATCEKYSEHKCLGSKANQSRSGPYVYKSYGEVNNIVQEIGSGIMTLKLYEEVEGVKMVAIYGKNCEEWLMTDMAACFYGVTSVAIYDTLGEEAMKYILEQTQISTIFSTVGMMEKMVKDEKWPGIKNIVFFQQQESIDYNYLRALEKKGYRVQSIEEIRKVGKSGLIEYPQINSQTVATISYTSGTTGNPKGVMLSHSQLLSVMGSLQSSPFNIQHTDVHLSYLPLAHIFERMLSYFSLLNGASIGYYQGDVLKLKEDMSDLKPTIFGSVPRLYNRFYDVIKGQMDNAPGLKKTVARQAIASKLAKLEQSASVTHSLYDGMVFNKVKQVFGGRVRVMVTASAPIDGEVLKFLKIATICPIIEGYGQTESGGASYMTYENDPEVGHVGGPATNVEFKLKAVPDMEYLISDTDETGRPTPRGELLIRGTGIFSGYFRDQERTQEALDANHWLYTGDIVKLRPNGSIQIIDRKKNIFKLAQGEYVAAEKLEIGYRVLTEVEEIFVYGDSLQSYLVCIIFPNEQALRKLAQENGLDVNGYSMEQLCAVEQLAVSMQKVLAMQAKKVKFNGIEVPKKVMFIPKSFAEYDCLTTSFKLQRHQAKKKFIDQIHKMYEL